MLAGVGLYYYYYYYGVTTTPEQVTASTSKPVASTFTKDDFMLQVSVDKSTYRYGEPVAIQFNLTYIGGSTKSALLLPAPFRVRIWNETHSINQTTTLLTLGLNITFSYGRNITGKAVISDNGRVEYYNDALAGRPWASGDVIAFSPGSIYHIEGTAILGPNPEPNDSEKITAPPLKIRIIERPES